MKKKQTGGKLTSFNQMTPERAREIRVMGGKAGKNNPKLSLSRKLTHLKKKGLTDDTARQMWELMTNSEMSSLDILLMIKKLQSKTDDNKEDAIVISKMMDWHKLHHGEKKSVDVNVKTLRYLRGCWKVLKIKDINKLEKK